MKALRYLIGIAAVVAVSLISSYLFQYPLFNLYPEKVSVTGVVVLLFICGAFILIIEGALILLNKRFKWYSGHEVAKVIFITGLLYSALMIFVFPYIEVPYSWIPPREGALGYGVVLIQLFTIIPAVLSSIISLVYMIGDRD